MPWMYDERVVDIEPGSLPGRLLVTFTDDGTTEDVEYGNHNVLWVRNDAVPDTDPIIDTSE